MRTLYQNARPLSEAAGEGGQIFHEELRNFPPPRSALHPRSAPETAQTLDFIGYRGVCPQFYRGTGNGERETGMPAKKFSSTPISRLTRPSTPPRVSARPSAPFRTLSRRPLPRPPPGVTRGPVCGRAYPPKKRPLLGVAKGRGHCLYITSNMFSDFRPAP